MNKAAKAKARATMTGSNREKRPGMLLVPGMGSRYKFDTMSKGVDQ